jgi:LmbE family N-acetylglucosaminyl deacetylase
MTELRVLVIGTHPDDELLGCGGTVARHTERGDRATSVIVCEGESLRYGRGAVGQRAQVDRAAAILGVDDVRFLDHADQQLDQIPLTDVIGELEDIVCDVRPHIVYAQHGGDVNRDHQLVFQALLVATRPTHPSIHTVLTFDTPSSTEWGYPRTFVPDTWIDISSTLDRKLRAMACYESELRAYPHPRSLEAIAHRAHAWGSHACLTAAEVFVTVRRIERNGR